MRTKIFDWHGSEVVALSCEGNGKNAEEQAQDVFRRMDDELRGLGLSLENTVRTRLWARDRDSRSTASQVRVKTLSGRSRASSSSFIAPPAFDSESLVAFDLIAMRPSRPDTEKAIVEYDPPKVPCRYVTQDSFVFLTGEEAKRMITSPDLAVQLEEIISLLGSSLTMAGATWNEAFLVSCFLRRDQSPGDLKKYLHQYLQADVPLVECEVVDNYASQGGLLEVEVTARIA
ncbi:MAG: hypothetical protein HW416_2172 [Chloroflexi bacterium]|nr:hypothetical protein [Chloroflexota bacterium]